MVVRTIRSVCLGLSSGSLREAVINVANIHISFSFAGFAFHTCQFLIPLLTLDDSPNDVKACGEVFRESGSLLLLQ